MSRRQQHSSVGHNDDPDSDLDLDLEELDPVTSSHTAIPSRRPHTSQDYSGRIPLRNLGYGGRRRHRPAESDAEPLIADEDALGGKGEHVGDGVPLLANGNGRGEEEGDVDGLARTRSWKARLLRLLPFSKRHTSIALATEPLDSPSDDPRASSRTASVASPQPAAARYPANAISNAKYTPFDFLPLTLWNEFKLFLNLYFLLVALSQVLPALRIGYLSTYIAPLAFVLAVTLGKEGWDDVMRRRRDAEANREAYVVLRVEGQGGGLVGERKGNGVGGSKIGKRKKHDRLAEAEWEEEVVGGREEPSARVTEVRKSAKDLVVGDVLVLEKNQRVPADVIILKSIATDAAASEDSSATRIAEPLMDVTEDAPNTGAATTSDATTDAGGEAFIRTDQLDGETDWKLRVASPLTQTLPASEYLRLRITAGKPDKRVNDFAGTIELLPKGSAAYDPPPDHNADAAAATRSAALTVDNTAWANTVLASSTKVHAVVLYTGPQTRAALSTASSRSKTGLLELEINSLVKILCILTAALSLLLVALQRFENDKEERPWYVSVMRFLILFSTIVPISLRVNLDMAKSVYAYLINRDDGIPGTIVRTSTIPEDLGRIEYLLTDKTGTLTRNEMELRKVHVGSGSYGGEAMAEVREFVRLAFAAESGVATGGALWTPSSGFGGLGSATRTRREIGVRVRDLVLALALCHNVTPTFDEDSTSGEMKTSYQASSPDEIAIVQWTEAVGLKLTHRDRRTMTLSFIDSPVVKVEILHIFPFTSESKRMGIIVRFYTSLAQRGEDVVFYEKGADTVMSPLLAANDYIDEETGNMAREGLRTLVIGRKPLPPAAYTAFSTAYTSASLSLAGRDSALARVIAVHLETSLQPLGLTAIEDLLQPLIKPSLETLRNAGLKIWMLTGDKPETARSIALSARLVARTQTIHAILSLRSPGQCLPALQPLLASPGTTALLIDGQSLALYLSTHPLPFLTATLPLPSVIATRCSPSQKASLTSLIRRATGKRVLAIGDGGNDVSMISAADVGIGIEGKEGRQASLAADFSVTQFSHVVKLLLWHGRNSYKRSAALGQFVMHRGLLISVAQTVFSIHLAGEPVALYRDWLLVGYATVYTMMPVFSLVLDRDVDERLTNLYPELYHELQAGTSLSYRTFGVWTAISLYQGIVIQLGAQLLAPSPSPSPSPSAAPDSRMLLLSYTSLILNELLMVAASISTWHWGMWVSILATALLYAASVPFLGGYFQLSWVIELGFWWRLAALVGASVGPVWVAGRVREWLRPGVVGKVRG